MTTFPSLIDYSKTLQPFSIGFDKFFDEVSQMTTEIGKKAIANYPPYNIKQVEKNKYIIELAVAGFAKSDIEVTLEGNKLVIKGSAKEDEDADQYFHKGIANRNFIRTFTLADKIEIKNAEMVNGMLKVWLENLVQTQDAIKRITINGDE
jgi:molecular chaperone IbpA